MQKHKCDNRLSWRLCRFTFNANSQVSNLRLAASAVVCFCCVVFLLPFMPGVFSIQPIYFYSSNVYETYTNVGTDDILTRRPVGP